MENKLSKRGISQLSKTLLFRVGKHRFGKVNIKDFIIDYNQLLFSLQYIANKICQHYGMAKYTPVITYQKLKNAGGCVNLNKSKEIYIDIDTSQHYDKWQYISIIAHEVAHKYLFIHDVYYEGLKNEFVTDAMAVYAGYGDIMRLGNLKVTKHTRNRDYRRNELGQMRPTYVEHFTKTHTLGYLLPWQIEFLQHCLNNDVIEVKLFSHYYYILKPIPALISLFKRTPKR